MDENEFLASWRPWLRVTAARMTTHDPENLAAEGWVALWLALPAYDGRAPFDAWCKSVARNRMRNVIRDSHAAIRDRRREVCVGGPNDLALFEASGHLDVVQDGYHDGRVAEAVDALPPGYRDYVVKRFWEGYSTTELQRASGSGTTWTRAKRRLAAELAHLAGVAG